MALISCSECGKEISDQAESCPNCGKQVKKHNCPQCGRGNPAQAQFCLYCGASMSQSNCIDDTIPNNMPQDGNHDQRQSNDAFYLMLMQQKQSRNKKRNIIIAVVVVFLFLIIAVSYGKENKRPVQGNATSSSSTSSSSRSASSQSSKSSVAKSAKVEVLYENLHAYDEEYYKQTWAVYTAEILNTGNTPISLKDISVDVEDINGKLINTDTSISCSPSIAMPGEKLYICEQLLSLGDKMAASEIGSAILHYRVVAASKPYEPPTVKITEAAFKPDSETNPKFLARIENIGNQETKSFYVAVIVRDSKGNVIQLLSDAIDSVQPGEKIGMQATGNYYDYNYSLDSLQYEVIPYYWKYVWD